MPAANTSNISTIQILRSYSNSAPLTLDDGQLAFSFVSNTLFIGSNTGIKIISNPPTDLKAQEAYNQANTATVLAQASYNQANVTIGVDASQNARMSISDGVNTSQNVRLDFSNTRMAISDGVNVSQNVRLDFSNTRMTIIEGVDAGQNSRMTISDGVNASQNSRLDFSNTRMTIIEGVNVTQNTDIANKLSLSGASLQTVSGNVAFLNDVSVSGNLIVLGNTISLNVTSLEVKDTLIQLGIGNYNTDVLTIGYVGHYNDGTNAQAGMIRDAGTKEFYAFQGYTPGVTGNTVNINDASFAKANIHGNWFKGNLIATTARVGGLDVNSRLDFSNTRMAVIEGTDLSQNVRLNFSNTRMDISDGVNASQNVRLDFSNTRMTIIEGVDVGQNTRMTVIDGVNASQNVRLDFSNTAITIIQGVDVGQNARMTIVEGTDASQNVRLDFSNTRMNIIDGVDAGQNARMTIIEGTDTSQNARMTIIEGADASQNVRLDFSNTRMTIIEGVDAGQNSRMSISDGVNVSQNVRLDFSNAAITIIQGVDVGQNSRMTIIEGTDASQNVRLDFSNTRMNIIDGVDAGQNARMTIIEGVDASQNVRLDFSNTRMNIIDGVDVGQNNRMTIIEGTDTSQNARMAIIEGTNASQNVRLDFSNTAITIIQGVDVTQNTRLTVIEGTDASQNVRLDFSNAAITIIQGVDVGQNSRMTIIEGTDTSQNARIVVSEGVDLSQNVRLDFSNTAITIIQGVDVTQNTRLTVSEGVDLSQNVRLDFSNTRMNIIDGVDAGQNARMTIIEGVDVTQNTNIANRLALTGAASQTVTGNVVFGNDVTVTGNLVVLGNTISLNVTSFEVEDTLIQLGIGNYYTDALTIGYVGHYNDGTNAHAGMIRDALTKEFYAFQGYTPEVSGNVINVNAASFTKANIHGNWFKGNLIATTARVGGLDVNSRLDFSNTRMTIIEGVDLTQNTNIAATDNKMQGAYNVANTADVRSVAAYFHANGAFIKANAAFDQANVTIGVDASQNVRIDYSNTAITIIQGVDVGQNTRMTIIEGVDASQNVRLDYSNTALTIAQGVDNSQNVRLDFSNTAINATDGKMASAYNQANTGTVLAQAAFNRANTEPDSFNYLANTIVVANSAGYLSNSNVFFISSNNTLLVTSNTVSTSNTTGSLVVSGGVGITGNLFMSAANNFFLTTNGAQSYRLGWTDNYFMRSNQFGGAEFTGNFLNINSNFYTTSSYVARGVILNDTGNNTVLFAGSSPVRIQNTAASISNTTGSLIVDGGLGLSGNLSMNLASSAAAINRITLSQANFIYSDSVATGSVAFGGTAYYYFNNSIGVYNQNALIQRGTISKDDGNNTVIFAGISPVKIQNGTGSSNTTTGALVVQGGVGISGALNATTKSFNIPHPTKEGKDLRYGSLEGPEFGVYVRGTLKGSNVIELPDYWTKLVDTDTITVSLTPIGKYQKLSVKEIKDNTIIINNDGWFRKEIYCYYVVYGERADVDKLDVEG